MVVCQAIMKDRKLYNLKEIGKRIRSIRGFELNQAKFGKIMGGITQHMISKYEKGLVNPPIEFLIRLSEYSGKSIDWILKGEETKLWFINLTYPSLYKLLLSSQKYPKFYISFNLIKIDEKQMFGMRRKSCKEENKLYFFWSELR